MNGEVNFLVSNARYRIIHKAGEYYLIDIEKSIWLLFLPILLWLIPHKVYKINAEIAEELRAPPSYTKGSKGVVWFGAGGAAVLTPLLQPLLDQTIGSTILVNLLLLMILTTIIISFRLYLHKSLCHKVNKTVDVDKLETSVMRFWPRYFIQYINPFILILFIGFFMYIGFYLFLVTGNFIPLFGYFIALPGLLMSNMAFIDPRFGKKNVYRISIVR